MSSQGILNANLWLAKPVLIWKVACENFFLIKTTYPPVSTHHFVPHHSCCLYHYHTAAPKPQLCPGEIEIPTKWNPHLSSSPTSNCHSDVASCELSRRAKGAGECPEPPSTTWVILVASHICSTQVSKFCLLQLDLYCTDFQRQVRWRLGKGLPQWGIQWNK